MNHGKYSVYAPRKETGLDVMQAAVIRRACIDTLQLFKKVFRGRPVPAYILRGEKPKGRHAERPVNTNWGNLKELYEFFNGEEFEIFSKNLSGKNTWLQLMEIYDGWRRIGFKGKPISEEDA